MVSKMEKLEEYEYEAFDFLGEADFLNFRKDVATIGKKNRELFHEFAGYLVNHDFEADVIKGHIGHLDVYLNQFVVYFDPGDATEAQFGTGLADEFFDEWLPERNRDFKQVAGHYLESIGLFYKWLAEETGLLEAEEFEELLDLVAHRKNDWL